MKAFFILVRKDLSLEFRSREMIVLVFTLAVLLSVIVSSGLANAAVSTESMQRIFPTILWVVFLFTATLSIERSFEYEREHSAMEGLVLLSGVSPSCFYLSKVTSNFVFMSVAQLFVMLILSGLLSVPLSQCFTEMFFCSLLVVLGYSAIATLVAALSSGGRLRGMLLPLLLLPVLFPLFFAAGEISSDILVAGRFEFSSPWLSLTIGLDVLYLLLGINLFGQVVKE